MKRILLLAGEESGVLYAREIAARLRTHAPEVEVRGYGDYGFRTADLAVMGVGQVLARIFYFLRVKRTLQRAIDEWRPDAVCTVDYPGLNLKLAAYAKSRGIRTVHVVCPQVWAWKRGRIPKIEASVDRLCCFFPFEPALFKPGFATFVGHPLVDLWGEARRQNGGDGRTLAALPGSRIGEIEKILPTILESVRLLLSDRPDLKVVIPAANVRARAAIDRLVGASPVRERVTVLDGNAREALLSSDCAVVASGTATLEAALAGCPTVLVYRVGKLFEILARFFIRDIRHIGLANIVAEKAGVPCPMPELIQQDFTAENVRRPIAAWLTDAAARAEVSRALAETRDRLTSGGNALGVIVSQILMTDKESIRREMKARRTALVAASRAAASASVCAQLAAHDALDAAVRTGSPLAVYFASTQEIDLGPFLRTALARGVRLVAPRWNGETYELAEVTALDAPALRRGPMNILEPSEARLVAPADVHAWLVPGLAFTRDGRRLGYGGGWYDRLLATAPADALILGIAHPFQVVPDLPTEPHDRPLTALCVSASPT